MLLSLYPIIIFAICLPCEFKRRRFLEVEQGDGNVLLIGIIVLLKTVSDCEDLRIFLLRRLENLFGVSLTGSFNKADYEDS